HLSDIGCTLAYRINDDSHTISFGVAYQHPNDHDNRKLGRQIAQGRLLKGKHFAGSIDFNEYAEAHNGEPLNHAKIVKYIDHVRGADESFIPAANLKVLAKFNIF
ncbi:MAG: hypothetical protein PF495_12745, partial [Spirochaetales bacterium]|nr:hypothetical protein [Spirochaetales bacterium]